MSDDPFFKRLEFQIANGIKLTPFELERIQMRNAEGRESVSDELEVRFQEFNCGIYGNGTMVMFFRNDRLVATIHRPAGKEQWYSQPKGRGLRQRVFDDIASALSFALEPEGAVDVWDIIEKHGSVTAWRSWLERHAYGHFGDGKAEETVKVDAADEPDEMVVVSWNPLVSVPRSHLERMMRDARRFDDEMQAELLKKHEGRDGS